MLLCCFTADVPIYAARLDMGWWERVGESDIRLQDLSLRLQEYMMRHYGWDMVGHSILDPSGTL